MEVGGVCRAEGRSQEAERKSEKVEGAQGHAGEGWGRTGTRAKGKAFTQVGRTRSALLPTHSGQQPDVLDSP